MSDKPEHTADISAELRTLSRGVKQYGLQPTVYVYGKPIAQYLAELADRIDAASVGNCKERRCAMTTEMSDNETVDDVLADMLLPRFDAITAMRANNYDEIKSLVANYRDRIKAAYKREVEKFNSVIQATVSSSDAEIDHLRREREKLRKTLAQMAQTATAARTCNTSEEILRITYLDDIAKMCADALALFTDSPQNDNSGAANVTAGKQELNANSKSAQIEFGNVAKLREALGKLRAELWNNTVIAGKKKFALYEIADAALAAPPRNCDRYNSGDPVKDTDDACAEWQGQCDAEDVPPSCKVESAFRQWLFATAKPETKGENDGSK